MVDKSGAEPRARPLCIIPFRESDMAARILLWLTLAAGFVAGTGLESPVEAQASRPNIVLVFPDNLGWGEVGTYGAVRGVPTPNVDSIAAQGIRLDNFNVEF